MSVDLVGDGQMVKLITVVWHDIEGCHKHAVPSVQTEPSCCVCDMDDPCDEAQDTACDWHAERMTP